MMKEMKWQIIILGIFLVFMAFRSTLLIVKEGQQAIITQFGKPVGSPIVKAGAYFKLPFIQEVIYINKKILNWDGLPELIPTKDDKYIYVDTTARWKVVDALKFIQTVKNIQGAKTRLDTILDSIARDIISKHRLIETVRNSNEILFRTKQKQKQKQKTVEGMAGSNDLLGHLESIDIGREKLSKMIVLLADKELQEKFGIKLIDLQFRRISYKKSVEQKIYERMISEKTRIAQKIRSKGLGEKAIIEGRLIKDLQKIESESQKRFKIIKGRAKATAMAIYAKAYSQGSQFFKFTKTMDIYKETFKGEGVKFILSSNSEFLKFLK